MGDGSIFKGPGHSGKGDKPRPIKDRKKFEDNFDSIFGKKCRFHHKHTSECEGYEHLKD